MVEFQNGPVTHSIGFLQMKEFLMSANPGQFAMFLGESDKLQLRLSELMQVLQDGLIEEDFIRTGYFFHQIALQLGAEDLTIKYDRFETPYARIRGQKFPNTKTYIELGFLRNGKVVSDGYILSDDFVLIRFAKDDLEGLIDTEGTSMRVGDTVFIPPPLPSEINRPPDNFQKLVDRLAIDEVSKGNDVTVYSSPQYTDRQKLIMDAFHRFYYIIETNVGNHNLNSIVQLFVEGSRKIQETYERANQFINQEKPYLMYKGKI